MNDESADDSRAVDESGEPGRSLEYLRQEPSKLPAWPTMPGPPGQPITLEYLRPVQTDWPVIAVFSNAGEWHLAKAILQRSGVIARMGQIGDSDSNIALLVPSTEMLWATDVLRRAGVPADRLVPLRAATSAGDGAQPASPPAAPLPVTELVLNDAENDRARASFWSVLMWIGLIGFLFLLMTGFFLALG
jgi:hypothetical protein